MDDDPRRRLFDPSAAHRLVLARRPVPLTAVGAVVSDVVWGEVVQLLRWATADAGGRPWSTRSANRGRPGPPTSPSRTMSTARAAWRGPSPAWPRSSSPRRPSRCGRSRRRSTPSARLP
ncbi:hypothetical protein [Blastococcus litoris]|uniref:hypothetical protein n=1 Tax=Blastococcus litoris TaxID=2171622 RepID=UPI0013DF23C2|nr:hypothetical protein [Blastococcus litoris]